MIIFALIAVVILANIAVIIGDMIARKRVSCEIEKRAILAEAAAWERMAAIAKDENTAYRFRAKARQCRNCKFA